MRQAAIKTVAIYCRVSTSEQESDRQERDLLDFAERRGYSVLSVYRETASGAKDNRPKRAEIMQLARERKINAVLVTEGSRWGRSTVDIITTVQQLTDWGCSLICQTGLEFDLSTAQGKLNLTVLAGVNQYERDLLKERVNSGIAAAKARGVKFGRQPGQNPSDKYAKKVLTYLGQGRTVRWIAHELQISTNTVLAIKKRAA